MDLIAKHYFYQNLTTRFIRVMPLTWSHDPSIRIELYGCSGVSARDVYIMYSEEERKTRARN